MYTDEKARKIYDKVKAEVDAGMGISPACEKHNIAVGTFNTWRDKRFKSSSGVVVHEAEPKVTRKRNQRSLEATKCVVIVTTTQELSNVLRSLT